MQLGRKRLKERELGSPERVKGAKSPTSGEKQMNTLNLIRKQIEKASALHDAQILMTSYRGVKYQCHQPSEEAHGTFCYRGRTYTK